MADKQSRSEYLILKLIRSYIDEATIKGEGLHIDPAFRLRQSFAQYHIWHTRPNPQDWRCAFYFRVLKDCSGIIIIPAPAWGDVDQPMVFKMADIADPEGQNIRTIINKCLDCVRNAKVSNAR